MGSDGVSVKFQPMKAEIRDITRPLTEAIIIPANGCGYMDRGAAKDIVEVAGAEIQIEAKNASRVWNFSQRKFVPSEPGTCFSTQPFKMARRGVKHVYHAVTMKYPGGVTSLDFVNKAIRAALDRAVKDGVKSVAICGIGTGEGRLDRRSIARLMVELTRNVSDLMEIKIADTDKEFINEVGQFLGEVSDERTE